MTGLQEKEIGCILVPKNSADGRLSLLHALQALGERGINEVQVEAGSTLCGSLLAENLVDEILLYQAPSLLGLDGAPAFAFGPLESMDHSVHLEILDMVRTGPDLRYRLAPRQAG